MAAQPPTPGSHFGPYEIVSALGAGGMGEVYKAKDARLDRLVAIKILPGAFAHDPDRLARFEREAKAVAALSHPNILSIFDFGVHDKQAYAVMELLDGETLRERLTRGALPVRKATEYAIQVARGLAAAPCHRGEEGRSGWRGRAPGSHNGRSVNQRASNVSYPLLKGPRNT